MKKVLLLFLLGFISFAQAKGNYYLDHKQVMLYKIMNWWNTNGNETETTPCSKPIQYTKEGDLQINYNSSSKELTFFIEDGFTNLIDIFKECKNCYGPSYLKAIFLNQKYFNNTKVNNITKELSQITHFTFSNISKDEAFKIINMKEDIIFKLEGIVGGLLLENNKISLHQSGDFFRSCPKQEEYPVNFIIINNVTQEILVEYTMIWDSI